MLIQSYIYISLHVIGAQGWIMFVIWCVSYSGSWWGRHVVAGTWRWTMLFMSLWASVHDMPTPFWMSGTFRATGTQLVTQAYYFRDSLIVDSWIACWAGETPCWGGVFSGFYELWVGIPSSSFTSLMQRNVLFCSLCSLIFCATLIRLMFHRVLDCHLSCLELKGWPVLAGSCCRFGCRGISDTWHTSAPF